MLSRKNLYAMYVVRLGPVVDFDPMVCRSTAITCHHNIQLAARKMQRIWWCLVLLKKDDPPEHRTDMPYFYIRSKI